MNEILNKPLYFYESGRLNVSNIIDPDDLDFFDEYFGEYYEEIVYYEHDRPLCLNCNISMNSNGSRPAKPNKWDGIRKKQYICPICGVEKHITLVLKILSKDIPILLALFVIKQLNMNLYLIYLIRRKQKL